MRTIVFTGAAGPAVPAVVGRAVGAGDEPWDVRVLAPRATAVAGARVETVDLVSDDVDVLLEGADVVVHLGGVVDDRDPYGTEPGRVVADARSVLAAAARCGVSNVVVVSSALVLGAAPSNPVPLTEAAVVHPESAFRPAVETAEIERIVAEHRGDDVTITVLRAAPVVADGAPGWLASEMHRSLAYPVADRDPGLQYLHAADLGSAIGVVVDAPPGGVVHVAPDGALSGPERRALETRPRLRVTDRVAGFAASVRSTARGSGAPEGIRPYLAHEWSLANDRLRGLGWEPSYSNEQAYVAAFEAAPWSMIPSGRRQELLLGGVGALAAGVAAGVVWAVRRRPR